MTVGRRLADRGPAALLAALPVASLALALAAWLRFGVDLPWYDDWRGYDGGWIQSLGLRHLFTSINYTLSPVGLALDAIAQRTLAGHAVAYQFLSQLLVLGALLLLQWRLLMLALDDWRQAAACFSLCVLMVQPDSYWGLENLAYHQALPLVFVAAALLVALRGTMPAPVRRPVLAGMALLAGFSYISGAFGALAAGLALLLAAWRLWPAQGRGPLLRDAAWFTAGAAVATGVQFSVSFLGTHGTPHAVPLALPHQAVFWWFYLGKIARSLMLPVQWPAASFVATLAVCAAAAALGIALVRQAVRPQAQDGERRAAAVLVALAATVLVYLMLVAAGRAALRPAGADAPMAVFAHAFERFHYFWVTLLWPWVLAAAILLARRRPGWQRMRIAGGTALGAVAVLLAAAGAYGHVAFQRERGFDRELALHCLQEELRKPAPVRCKGLLPPRPGDAAPDSRPAVLHASRIGASFVRQAQAAPDDAPLAGLPRLFDLDGSAGRLELHQLRQAGPRRFVVEGPDPQMFLNAADAALASRCTGIELVASMQVERPDRAQLYWGATGFRGPYEERLSDARGLVGGAPETVRIRLRSQAGFHPGFRFDPVAAAPGFILHTLKVYCLPPPE